MYGDPCASLVDVVVLYPRHGLQAHRHRLTGQSLQLSHLMEVRSGQIRSGQLGIKMSVRWSSGLTEQSRILIKLLCIF